MKKIAFVLFGLAAIGAAQAGTLLSAANKYSILSGDCSLMNEDVKLALSSNVQGAYACDAASSPTGISVATCHTGGRTANRSITCTATDVTNAVAGCDAAGTVVTKGGPVVAVASSLAPSVGSTYPGTGTCGTDGATAKTGADTKLSADQTAAKK